MIKISKMSTVHVDKIGEPGKPINPLVQGSRTSDFSAFVIDGVPLYPPKERETLTPPDQWDWEDGWKIEYSTMMKCWRVFSPEGKRYEIERFKYGYRLITK